LCVRPLKIYRLGRFSEIYFNCPRDSDIFKHKVGELLGEGNEGALNGYSALEIALSEIMYSQEDGYHILSSILADAIFSMETRVDAIVYPTMKNMYGINVALNQENADALKVSYSTMNEIINVYENGFFEYETKQECRDFSNPDKLLYEEVLPGHVWR